MGAAMPAVVRQPSCRAWLWFGVKCAAWGIGFAFFGAFLFPLAFYNIRWFYDIHAQYTYPFPGLERGHGPVLESGFYWTWMTVRSRYRVSVSSQIVNANRLTVISMKDQGNPGLTDCRAPWWTEPADNMTQLSRQPHLKADAEGIAPSTTFHDEAWGWPMLAITSRVWDREDVETDPEVIKLTGSTVRVVDSPLYGITVRNLLPQIAWNLFGWKELDQHCQYLPLRILWCGLLVNGATMGTFLSLPWVGPPTCRCVRGRLRARRGQCTTCGYPRAGLTAGAACPECGG